MKKFLVFLCAIFIYTVCFARNVNWQVDNQIIQTTTCETGDSVTPPVAPTKYGYTFVNWVASDNLLDITALEGVSGITILNANSFSFSGYPKFTAKFKELAPNLKEGDTATINATTTSNVLNFYINGSRSFGVSMQITQTMLNSYVGFYCRNDTSDTCTITNLRIIKNNNE